MGGTIIAVGFLVLLGIWLVVKTAIVVPQQSAYIVENLGKYSKTLKAGFHILVPVVETVAYKLSLKERALDIHRQLCITKDNVQVEIDAVIYLQVFDAVKASYGIEDYLYGIAQLAQTTLRSEIGKIELDRTFEERSSINAIVVQETDKAAEPWGVKVLRYEIKDITPPGDILSAMEKQMRAEREKRAAVLESEGHRDAEINRAEGFKQRMIKESEAKKQQQINEAEGQASAILAVAEATAEGLQKVAESLQMNGGQQAMDLRIAEQYIKEFGKLAGNSNTLVLSADIADIGSMIQLAKGLANKPVAAAKPKITNG